MSQGIETFHSLPAAEQSRLRRDVRVLSLNGLGLNCEA